jgi:hypothetical protein
MAVEPSLLEAETREKTDERERERTRRSGSAAMALLPRPRSQRHGGGRADTAREPAPASLRRGTRRRRSWPQALAEEVARRHNSFSLPLGFTASGGLMAGSDAPDGGPAR